MEKLLAGMDLKQKVAQMFMVTPEALTGYSKVTAAGEVTKQCFIRYPAQQVLPPGQYPPKVKQRGRLQLPYSGYSCVLDPSYSPFLISFIGRQVKNLFPAHTKILSPDGKQTADTNFPHKLPEK